MELPSWAISILGTLFVVAAGLCWTLIKHVGKHIVDDISGLGVKIDKLGEVMTAANDKTNARITGAIVKIGEIDTKVEVLKATLDPMVIRPSTHSQ